MRLYGLVPVPGRSLWNDGPDGFTALRRTMSQVPSRPHAPVQSCRPTACRAVITGHLLLPISGLQVRKSYQRVTAKMFVQRGMRLFLSIGADITVWGCNLDQPISVLWSFALVCR
jgi:hypothetical protein